MIRIRRGNPAHTSRRETRSNRTAFTQTKLQLALVLGVGTAVIIALGRRDDIATAGITTAVVMVVAATHPREAWLQPSLRLFDTAIGIAVGVGVNWIGWALTPRQGGLAGVQAKPRAGVGDGAKLT